MNHGCRNTTWLSLVIYARQECHSRTTAFRVAEMCRTQMNFDGHNCQPLQCSSRVKESSPAEQRRANRAGSWLPPCPRSVYDDVVHVPGREAARLGVAQIDTP